MAYAENQRAQLTDNLWGRDGHRMVVRSRRAFD
jgi:hypothetical protein